MTIDAHANFAYSTVATAPSPATSGTSLVVASGDGALFPAVPFNAVICPIGTQPTTANAEIVRVTARSTDTLTITRAQESSSARTVIVGDQIFAGVTAKTLTDVETSYVANTLLSTTGDVIYASAANTPARLAVGAAGDQLRAGYGTVVPGWRKPAGYYLRPSGAIAEVFERHYTSGTALTLTSATLYMSAIELEAGMVISNFNIRTAGGGGATLTNEWMALFDSSRVQLATTADQGLASMAATTVFTWPITQLAGGAGSTYTVPTSGLYYVGLMIKGTTPPTMPASAGVNLNGTPSANLPYLFATSNTAQAGIQAFPFTAATLVANSGGFYAWLT